MEFIKLISTALLSVVSLFIITKIIGRKQIAELDFFDYVNGITIGSIAAELATNIESPWKPFVALVLYGGSSCFLNFLARRFPKSRKFVNGTPTILMDNGKIYRENLKKSKLDLSEFMMMCREAGYFDLKEIQSAIFESNGRISILPRSVYRPINPSDVGIEAEKAKFGVELIMDGRVLSENIYRLGKDGRWLEKLLKSKGYKSADEIFLAIWNGEGEAIDFYPIK